MDEPTGEKIVRALLEARTPLIYAGGGVLLADAAEELRELASHLAIPVAHTLMGKGALPDDHPLTLGMTGFWGTQVRQRQVPGGRLDPRPRHALRRSRLQLVGRRVHVQHAAFEADPHRHRFERDRPQLPGRDRRRQRPQGGADRPQSRRQEAGARRARSERQARRRDRGLSHRIRRRQPQARDERQLPDAPGADPRRGARGPAARRHHHHRRRLEQERRRPAVSDLHAGQHPDAGRLRHHGLRRARGDRRQAGVSGQGRASRWSAMAASARTPRCWRPRSSRMCRSSG